MNYIKNFFNTEKSKKDIVAFSLVPVFAVIVLFSYTQHLQTSVLGSLFSWGGGNNMDSLTVAGLVAVAGLIATVCSIASFWLGQKKSLTSEGKDKGVIESNISNIKNSVYDLTKAFDKMSVKLEVQEEKRENDYRGLLVAITELQSSYKSLHHRANDISARVEKLEEAVKK